MMRKITLLLKDVSQKDIEKLETYCKDKNITMVCTDKVMYHNGRLIDAKSNKIIPLYDFYIVSDTNGFNELNEYMDKRIITTGFADISNIADKDDKFEQDLKNCITLMEKASATVHKANTAFHEFIMPIKETKILNALQDYSVHMNDTQKRTLRTRIAICSGEREKNDEEWIAEMLSVHCDVKELREKTGMNRKEFCKYFNIPYRTVEDWENKKSTCAVYLFNLMKEKLERDNYI